MADKQLPSEQPSRPTFAKQGKVATRAPINKTTPDRRPKRGIVAARTPIKQTTPGLLAKRGKVAAVVCVGLFIVAFVGLVLIESVIAYTQNQLWTDYFEDEKFSVNDLAIGEDGQVWVVAYLSGLEAIALDGQTTTYTHANSGLTDDTVLAIAIDAQNRVWVGPGSGGLNMLAPDGNWTSYSIPGSDNKADRARHIAIDGQGRVWVGTNYGLKVLEPADGSWTVYTTDNSGLAFDGIDALAIDEQGRVWMGAWQGLSMLAPDSSWTTYAAPYSKSVLALATDKAGRVWVASTSSGISMLAPDGSWKTYTPAEYGFDKNDVYAADVADVYEVKIDNQNRVWIGAADGKLSVLDSNDQWTAYTPDNTGGPTDVRGLAIDMQGRVWVGHADGLSMLDVNAGVSAQTMAALVAIRTGLIGLSLTAFVLMLIVVAIADVTPDRRVRQFVIGFIGWLVLNAIAGILIIMPFRIDCINNGNCGFGEGMFLFLILIVVLTIMNIGILIFLGVTRRWWMLAGMVAAFIGSIAVIWILSVL